MNIIKRIFSAKKQSSGFDKLDWAYVISGLSVFVALASWTITKFSIWFDEAYGAYLIRFDFFEIAKYTAADVHPPFYYWLLKLWSMVFGNSELALRSMSVVFGAIAIVLGYILVKKLFNQNAARLSMLFMVISPMFIRYSDEARMYTLVAAIAIGATLALTYAMESKKKLPWVIYAVLVSLGMWTHYFAAIVWLAHWIWRVDVVRNIAKKGKFIKTYFSKEWILTHVLAIGLFIPWMPFFAAQLFTVQAFGFWIPPVTPDTFVNFMTNIFYYQDVGNVTGWLAFGFWLAVIMIISLAIWAYKKQSQFGKQNYKLVLSLAFIPMLLLFLLSMPPLRPSFIDRYLITSSVGIAIFIAVTFAIAITSIKGKWKYILPIFVVFLMTVGVTNVWEIGNYNKNSHASNNTKQIVDAIHAKSSGNEPIIADKPWFFYEVVFYETDEHPVMFLDYTEYNFGSLAMLSDNDQFKIKQIDEFTDKYPTFWYVGYSTDGNLEVPYDNWVKIGEVTVNDTVSGNSAYIAGQYKIAD